ncbi:hypothetical protein PT974_09549 [Cladobotryum mycophilum]|uniref:Heterokaryon incompatibility domain-containing protein n=1 Tax=Cladobotryum mycophilum TaxID=491253 RepID=A0ABR0SGF6_9HYPO
MIILLSNYQHAAEGEKVIDLTSTYDLYIAAGQATPAYRSQTVGGRYLGLDRSSAEYVAAIKKWVEDCANNHGPKCCMTVSKAERVDPYDVPLPSRCIDVGGSGDIVLRDCAGVRGSYITLSHRWTDETQQSKTTKNNWGLRLHGLEFDNLSKSLNEVISFTRQLGVRYIWIDSICIIQDDPADLHKELLNMAQYYQNSLFTLASEIGTKHTNGLLRLPNQIDKLIQLPYMDSGKQRGNLYVYKQKWKTNDRYLSEVGRSELLSRGWVFQEWFLSGRIVHFAPSDTYLECRSQRPLSVRNQKIEVFSIESKSAARKSDLDSTKYSTLRLGFKSEFHIDAELSFDMWYGLAQSYAQLHLTKASDHLNAIAGIASEFTQAVANLYSTRDELISASSPSRSDSDPHMAYISGLWLPDINHGLLWRAMHEDSGQCGCGSPSWSWLSLAGPVTWPERHDLVVDECEVISVDREQVSNSASYLITMTTTLKVLGKVQPVLVRGQMGLALDRDLAILTGTKYTHGKSVHLRRFEIIQI